MLNKRGSCERSHFNNFTFSFIHCKGLCSHSCFQGQNTREQKMERVILSSTLRVFFSIRGRFLLQNPHWHCEIQLTYTCGLEQASVCAWSQFPICFLQSRPEKFDCSKSANVTCRFVLLFYLMQIHRYFTVGLRFALKSLSEGEQHSASGFKTKPLIVWGTGTTVLHRLSGFIYIPVNVFIWLRQRDTFPAELVLPWFEPSIKPWKQ